MNDTRLDRARADVAFLQEILGLGSSEDDAAGHGLLAVSGILTVLWTAFSPPDWHFIGLLSVLVPVTYLTAQGVKHRASSAAAPVLRRQYGDAMRVLLLGIPIAGYSLWAQTFGVPPPIVLATALFFVGIMMLGGVPQYRPLLPWALAMIAAALVIPTNVVSAVTIIGLALIAAGSAAALIALRQAAARP